MIRTAIFCLLVASPLAAVPAAAGQGSDKTVSATAEVRTAEAYTRVSPDEGGAYIELAQAYMRADRPVDAAAAYRRALTLDNEMMQTRLGDDVWSHKVAADALARLPQLSVR